MEICVKYYHIFILPSKAPSSPEIMLNSKRKGNMSIILFSLKICKVVTPTTFNTSDEKMNRAWIFYPSALRAGGVLSSRSGRAGGRAGVWLGGRAGGCQTCGTHNSITAWRIFSIRSSVELSRPVGVHCHGHMPICPIWACPWAKNLSNLPQIGSRLCGTHISETAGWIYPI